MKHADEDAEDSLEVHGIVASNDLTLFLGVVRFGVLFGEYTHHMWMMLMFAALQYPRIITWDAIPDLKAKLELVIGHKQTRGELAKNMASAISVDENCQAEVAQDLADVAIANAEFVKPPA